VLVDHAQALGERLGSAGVGLLRVARDGAAPVLRGGEVVDDVRGVAARQATVRRALAREHRHDLAGVAPVDVRVAAAAGHRDGFLEDRGPHLDDAVDLVAAVGVDRLAAA
jgi:hypothetical protein